MKICTFTTPEHTRYNNMAVRSPRRDPTQTRAAWFVAIQCGFDTLRYGSVPYFTSEKKALNFRRDLIALLKKHGWKVVKS